MKRNTAKRMLWISGLCLVTICVTAYLVYSLTSAGSRLTLFPGDDIRTGTFSDTTEVGGKSVINGFNVTPGRIMFSYTLKDGYSLPYAGFALRTNGLMDLSSFDVMNITIRSTHSHSIRVILLADIPGFTKQNDYSTYLLLQSEVVLRNDNHAYVLRLSDFFTPEWWWASRDAAEDDPRFGRALGRIYSISIQSGTAEPVATADTILVEAIGFSKNRQPLLILAVSVPVVYAAALVLFLLLRRYQQLLRKRLNKVVIAANSMVEDRGLDETTRTIIRYIGENYSNPGMSVDTVSRDCGIPAARVPQCIKEHFGLHFPQYLTAIRLAEAKRLLRETGLTIAEIAYKVGFSSIPHFNRVFKSGEGSTPKDFRRKTQGRKHPA